MQVDNYGVHVTHCCVSHCKYGAEDCPVANGEILPEYKCEDCTCIQMNPEAEKLSEVWWASLPAEEKVHLYLGNKLWNS